MTEDDGSQDGSTLERASSEVNEFNGEEVEEVDALVTALRHPIFESPRPQNNMENQQNKTVQYSLNKDARPAIFMTQSRTKLIGGDPVKKTERGRMHSWQATKGYGTMKPGAPIPTGGVESGLKLPGQTDAVKGVNKNITTPCPTQFCLVEPEVARRQHKSRSKLKRHGTLSRSSTIRVHLAKRRRSLPEDADLGSSGLKDVMEETVHPRLLLKPTDGATLRLGLGR